MCWAGAGGEKQLVHKEYLFFYNGNMVYINVSICVCTWRSLISMWPAQTDLSSFFPLLLKCLVHLPSVLEFRRAITVRGTLAGWYVLSHYFLCCPLVGNFTWNMVSCCSMRTWCKIQQGPKCWCWVRNLSGTWCGQELGKRCVSKWHVTWNLHGYVEELDVNEEAGDFAEVHLDSLEFCLFFRYL